MTGQCPGSPIHNLCVVNVASRPVANVKGIGRIGKIVDSQSGQGAGWRPASSASVEEAAGFIDRNVVGSSGRQQRRAGIRDGVHQHDDAAVDLTQVKHLDTAPSLAHGIGVCLIGFDVAPDTDRADHDGTDDLRIPGIRHLHKSCAVGQPDDGVFTTGWRNISPAVIRTVDLRGELRQRDPTEKRNAVGREFDRRRPADCIPISGTFVGRDTILAELVIIVSDHQQNDQAHGHDRHDNHSTGYEPHPLQHPSPLMRDEMLPNHEYLLVYACHNTSIREISDLILDEIPESTRLDMPNLICFPIALSRILIWRS